MFRLTCAGCFVKSMVFGCNCAVPFARMEFWPRWTVADLIETSPCFCSMAAEIASTTNSPVRAPLALSTALVCMPSNQDAPFDRGRRSFAQETAASSFSSLVSPVCKEADEILRLASIRSSRTSRVPLIWARPESGCAIADVIGARSILFAAISKCDGLRPRSSAFAGSSIFPRACKAPPERAISTG